MVSDERYVEQNGEPFPSKQEEKVDEDVEEVLREDQWIQAVALVNWVLVIRLQFIKSNNLKQQYSATIKSYSVWLSLAIM